MVTQLKSPSALKVTMHLQIDTFLQILIFESKYWLQWKLEITTTYKPLYAILSSLCFSDFFALSKCFVLSHLSVNIDATFSKKNPLPFRFYHQRYQQVVEKPSEKAVLILERAINGAITYTLLFASPPQKNAAILYTVPVYGC